MNMECVIKHRGICLQEKVMTGEFSFNKAFISAQDGSGACEYISGTQGKVLRC